MSYKKQIKKIMRSLLPPIVYHTKEILIKKYFNPSFYQQRRMYKTKILPLLSKNKELKDIYKNQRCFIVGCGPSISKENLLPLKNEICITLNDFHYHKQYKEISPQYHLNSGYSLNKDILSPQQANKWFKTFEKNIPTTTTLISPYNDYRFINNNNFYKNHTVHYLYMNKDIQLASEKGIDLTQAIYGVQNVAGMAIQIAMYIGCKDIYLVGLDYSWLEQYLNYYNYFHHKEPVNQEHHFYQGYIKNSVANFYYNALTKNKKAPPSLLTELQEISKHLKQYEALKKTAKKNSISIYNATRRTFLDIFPRVDFDSLFVKNCKTTYKSNQL